MKNNTTRSIDNEHRMTRIESDINAILTNHLVHLQAQIDTANKKLNWLIGLVVATAITGRFDLHSVLTLFK